MSTLKAFIAKHPVRAYYAVVFAVSWGGFLVVGGAGMFSGTGWRDDPAFPAAILAMLAGPPAAGILLTALVSGRGGLRELGARLFKLRPGARRYAAALLIAPVVQAAVLLLLALFSPVFLPAVFTAADKPALVVSGIVVGLLGGFVEELGWTGFVIPRLLRRRGVLPVGLLVGVLWGVWHLLQMFRVGVTSAEAIPLFLFLAQFFLSAIAQLTAYRVLMVWVYGRTESLLAAILMHASYILSTLFVLAPPTTGKAFLSYSWIFTAVLWMVVATVVVFDRRRPEEKENHKT